MVPSADGELYTFGITQLSTIVFVAINVQLFTLVLLYIAVYSYCIRLYPTVLTALSSS